MRVPSGNRGGPKDKTLEEEKTSRSLSWGGGEHNFSKHQEEMALKKNLLRGLKKLGGCLSQEGGVVSKDCGGVGIVK